MAKERPPDWMPSFSYSSARSHQAASSAPGLRFCRALSNPPRSPESSDDENTSITNRCSPKAVYLLVSKLSEFKKELVRDIGFGGILDLPCINKVNLKLSAWLLTKLDTEDSELVLAESKRIYIHEKDVGIVFGIPCGDIDIASLEVTPEQIESIRGACGIISKDPRSFKGLEYVLEKHLDDRSSRLELDSFKMAFVIFVLGHLLAPSGKYDCLHLDFWGALKDTELLYRMNWCRYVYSHVLDAAQKARDEMIRKNRITNLIGCHLFLQVLFLDNVDIRGLNKKHDIIPRIKLFDADSFKKMATMCESRGGNDFNSFIAVCTIVYVYAFMRDVKKLRRKNDTASLDNPILNPLVGSEATRICKTTHMQLPSPDTTSTVGSEQQNVAVNKQQFDFEAPSFDLGIDTSPVGASYVTPKSQVVPMHSVLSPIPFPPTSPSTYRTSHSELPLSPISATVEIAKELVQDMIDIIEDGSSQKDYVLYGKQVTENFLREPFPLSALPTPSCPSHQINTTPDPDTLHMLHIYVRESKHIDAMSLWIVHPFPRQLVIPAKDIKDNFLTPMLTEFHIVDAIIRRLNQVDVAHKEGQINLRWRHFLESDFAMQAISGFHPELTQSVLNQFIHMDYSVPYCKKIIIPVLVHDIWAAYMYDMQQEVVHILDPGHSASRYAAHVHFQKLIYVCMENCFNAYFTGFKFSNNPNLQVHYPKLCELFPSEDSAFCMLHLARYFDGAELQILINKDDMHRVRTTFLFEALSLDQNEATLPGMVVRLTRRA